MHKTIVIIAVIGNTMYKDTICDNNNMRGWDCTGADLLY